jgi:hypothetical protein
MASRRKRQVETLGVNICEAKKLTSFVPKQRQAPVHTTPSRDFTLSLSLCYNDCAFTFQEFIETLECIIPFIYHLDPIVVELR